MTTKNKKPETFGNKYNGCLVASIAAFQCVDPGIVKIRLKSGDVTNIDFKVPVLRNAAFKWLKAKFNNTDLECNPCNICENKEVKLKEELGYSKGATFCEICYNTFDKFKSTKLGVDHHADKIKS